MSKLFQPEQIANIILIPLAEAFESLCRDPLTLPGYYLLISEQIPHHFEVARRHFEYFKTPSHAQAFSNRVTDSITRFRELPFPPRPQPLKQHFGKDEEPTLAERELYDEWEAEWRRVRLSDEYRTAVASAADTADYLRQLALMMTEQQQQQVPSLPETRGKSDRELIRENILNIVRNNPNADYRAILDILDSSGRTLQEDSLFRKWVEEYAIQCWADVAGVLETNRRFQKWLSTQRSKMKK